MKCCSLVAKEWAFVGLIVPLIELSIAYEAIRVGFFFNACSEDLT